MKTRLALFGLVSVLTLAIIFGCRTQPATPTAAMRFDSMNPATPAQVETAKQRIHLLRTEMTDEQVFATLGLSDCYGRCMGEGNGPTDAYQMRYDLRNDQIGVNQWVSKAALSIVRHERVPGKSTLLNVVILEWQAGNPTPTKFSWPNK